MKAHSRIPGKPNARWWLTAAVLAVLCAGCSYAPLPSTSAAAEESVSSVVAKDSSTALPDIDGQVCCVASESDAPTVVEGISTTYNGWDTAFISWMVPHFAVASQLAELAPTRAGNPTVKSIATKIDGQLSPNYLKMATMAKAWGQPVPSTDPNAASGHDHGGDDTSGADNAATLTTLSGAGFDKKYLAIVVADDKAALKVAQATVANGVNPEAKTLAQQIIGDATAQISQIGTLLPAVS